jgi:enediyne biosynthesis protein E4
MNQDVPPTGRVAGRLARRGPPLAFVAAVLAAALPLAATVPQDDPVLGFVDVAAQSGLHLVNVAGAPEKDYIVESNGNGAAFFDYDNDGLLDVLIVNGSTLEVLERHGGHPMVALYRNRGGGRFTDVTVEAGLTRRGWGVGVCVADYDNDGFQDIYVTAFGPNVLWRNNGNGTFTATGQAADARYGTGCAFGDYDGDGHLDLYVANFVEVDRDLVPGRDSGLCRFMNIDTFCGPRPLTPQADVLYRNTGTGTFVDVTEAAGIAAPAHYGFGVLFTDLDGDGWPDIYVANDSMPNFLFRNRGDGTFVEEGLLAGAALSLDGREQAGMGVDAGDYEGHGHPGLLVTNFAQDYTTLYRNLGGLLFRDVSLQAGLTATMGPYLGWGVGFVDLDNDGLLDVFVANGHVYPDVEVTRTSTYRQRNQVFRNLGRGTFRHVAATAGGGLLVEESTRGAAFGDFDNTGTVDVLLVNMDAPPTLLRNDTAGGNWITLRLEGTVSNRDAVGARVTAEAGGRRQTIDVRSGGSYLSHHDMRVHVGLGRAAHVDRLVIRWPSGLVETVTGVAANRFYVAREGSGVRPGP